MPNGSAKLGPAARAPSYRIPEGLSLPSDLSCSLALVARAVLGS